MLYLRLLFLLAALTAAAAPVRADLITYNSEAALLATGTIAHTETFDEFPTPTFFYDPVATIDGVNYTSSRSPGIPPSNPYWTVGINLGAGFVTPPNDFGPNDLENRSMDFGAGDWALAVGFYVLPVSTAKIDIVVTEADGVQTVFDETLTTQPSYFGFSSTDGISRIDFGFLTTQKVNWSFDNVSRSTIVPEPATIILFGSVLLGASVTLRSRRLLHTIARRPQCRSQCRQLL